MISRIVRSLPTVRAPRIALQTSGFKVEAKTLGAAMSFFLATENLSRTGMLLDGGEQKLPYRINTLLELKVDPDGSRFERPITCLAKVVRINKPGEDELRTTKARYGVQIVQMDDGDSEMWERALSGMEDTRVLAPKALPVA